MGTPQQMTLADIDTPLIDDLLWWTAALKTARAQ